MPLDLNDKTLAALKEEYAPDATEAQFDLWIEKCRRDDLVPVEDVVLQLRSSMEWDSVLKTKVPRKRPVYITTVRALTKIAQRTGKYRGTLPYLWIYLDEANLPNLVSEIPLPDSRDPSQPREPWAARVAIRHEDFPEPVHAVVRFNAYAQTVKRGDSIMLNNTWATRGPEQLAKCGFAAALRAVFPEAAGLYLKEELEREEHDVPVSQPAPESAAVPVLSSVPKPEVVEIIEAPAIVNSTNDPADPAPEPVQKMDAPPTPDEKKEFGVRLRKIAEGTNREDLRAYMERVAGNSIKQFTVGQYDSALETLEAAKSEGKLVELLTPQKAEA